MRFTDREGFEDEDVVDFRAQLRGVENEIQRVSERLNALERVRSEFLQLALKEAATAKEAGDELASDGVFAVFSVGSSGLATAANASPIFLGADAMTAKNEISTEDALLSFTGLGGGVAAALGSTPVGLVATFGAASTGFAISVLNEGLEIDDAVQGVRIYKDGIMRVSGSIGRLENRRRQLHELRSLIESIVPESR